MISSISIIISINVSVSISIIRFTASSIPLVEEIGGQDLGRCRARAAIGCVKYKH